MSFNKITYRLPLVFNAIGKDEMALVLPPHGFAKLSHTSFENFERNAKVPIVTEEFLGLQFNLGTDLHYNIEGISGSMQTGNFNFLYLPAGLECECSFERGPFSSFSIHFPKQYLELLQPNFPGMVSNLLSHAESKKPFALSKAHLQFDEVLKHKIDMVLQFKMEKGVCRETYFNCKVFDILLYSFETARDALKKKDLSPDQLKRIEQAHKYLLNNYAHSFSIDLVADLVGMDKYKLRRGFKKCYQVTMRDYIIDCRIKRAKAYLRDSNLSIGKIALMVGFKRQRYLSQIFKIKVGKTPRQVRDEQAGEFGRTD